MNPNDYQAIKDLLSSRWWQIIKEKLQKRIEAVERVLLEPTEDEMFWKNIEEKMNLLNYKKMERSYLKELVSMPDDILATKINLDNNKKTI